MGRPGLPVEVQRRFWRAMRAGVVLDDAAASVGVSKTVAWRWFREAGGVIPAGIQTGCDVHGHGDCRFVSVRKLVVGVLLATAFERLLERWVGRRLRSVVSWREELSGTRRDIARRSLRLVLMRGRGVRKRRCWHVTGGCVSMFRTSWQASIVRNRSAIACESTFPAIRRCACLTKQSIERCTSRGEAR